MSSGGATGSDPVVQFSELWAGLFEQARAHCHAVLKGFELICDPRTLRSRWLEDPSRALEGYFNSPAFLDLMRSSISTMTNLTAIQDQFARDFVRQVAVRPRTDVTELSDRLRSNEATLSSRLKAIEDRLASIETRLDTSLSPD
jgi:3-deoxy-D-arabino-heptulosonate 7-phosphate (DAHP) synthase class II